MCYIARLRNHVPLKEGLRLILASSIMSPTSLRNHVPLKEGLRQGLRLLPIFDDLLLRKFDDCKLLLTRWNDNSKNR